MRVYINELHPHIKPDPSFRYIILKTVKAFLKKEQLPGAEISVIFSDDTHLQSLNYRYRQKNQPTDVLAFPFIEGDLWRRRFEDGGKFILGEIYISLDQVTLQAEEDNVKTAERAVFLLIHGLYHLLGYEHDNDKDFEEMETLVQKLYKEIFITIQR